jgi:c-di-AMP phosphodiesterase-like protein
MSEQIDLDALVAAGNATEIVQVAVWLDAEAQYLADHSETDPALEQYMEGMRAGEQYQRDFAREIEGMTVEQVNEHAAKMDAWRAALAAEAE